VVCYGVANSTGLASFHRSAAPSSPQRTYSSMGCHPNGARTLTAAVLRPAGVG
jgi:hypothetical protein